MMIKIKHPADRRSRRAIRERKNEEKKSQGRSDPVWFKFIKEQIKEQESRDDLLSAKDDSGGIR